MLSHNSEPVEIILRSTIDECSAERIQQDSSAHPLVVERISTSTATKLRSIIFSPPPRDPADRAFRSSKLFGKIGGWSLLIVQDVISYAGAKKLEWLMMGMTLHLAYKLSLPYETFANSNSFSVLQSYLNENSWAMVFSFLGIARLVVLTLNGLHFKHSAEMRMIMAAASFAIFSMWVWGIDAANAASLNGVICKWLAIGELMNIWQASADRLANKANSNAGKH
jgi:hypothetical protein